MKKCYKCGKDNLDDMQICGYCGAPLNNEENKNSVESKPGKSEGRAKKIIPLLGLMAVFAIISIIYYINSDSTKYKKAIEEMNSKEFLKAAETLKKISDYKDSSELYKQCIYENSKSLMESGDYESAQLGFDEIQDYEDSLKLSEDCAHLILVSNDTEAPTISGIEDKIEIKCGTEFNIKDYISKKIKISDNVTTNIKEYSVESDNEAMDQGSGDIDTRDASSFDITISTKDEAGNVGYAKSKIIIKAIHVTRKNKTPLVYDGKYGKVKIKSFKHGTFYGEKEYMLTLEVTNKTDEAIKAYLPSNNTCINNYQIPAYFTDTSISAGKTALIECDIYDKDIPSSIGDYNQIETSVCLSENKDDAKSFYYISLILDTNAAD